MKGSPHPEILEGEIFVCNSDPNDFSQIKFKEYRIGKTAYDEDGKPLENLVPVFAKLEETDKLGVTNTIKIIRG